MNLSIIPQYTINYYEQICSAYINDINFIFLKVALLNLIYFMFNNLIKKIPIIDLKIFKLNIFLIFESIVFFGNFFIIGTYFIFNFTDFIIHYKDLIWFIVYSLIIIFIILLIYFNKEKIMKIIIEDK